MIYSRFGSEVEMLAYAGKHKLKHFSAPMMLVKVRYKDDGSESYLFAHTLKADNGFKEIDAAVDALPEVTLEGAALKAALKSAE